MDKCGLGIGVTGGLGLGLLLGSEFSGSYITILGGLLVLLSLVLMGVFSFVDKNNK